MYAFAQMHPGAGCSLGVRCLFVLASTVATLHALQVGLFTALIWRHLHKD
jgi:hypothetical protein